jgi:hypothetical protein
MRKKKPSIKKDIDLQYMLFVFGDFEQHGEITKLLSEQLLILVSSNFLKYTFGEYGVVFNFRSKETFSDLKEYIDMALSDITEQYFLMEVTENCDIKMDDKSKSNFLNLDDEDGNEIKVEKKEFKIDKKNFITFDFILPIINSNFEDIEEIVEEPEPSVDDILDKITEQGIESLTKRETEILENYGKRKNGRD